MRSTFPRSRPPETCDVRDDRSGELLEHLLHGGTVAVDDDADQLVLVPPAPAPAGTDDDALLASVLRKFFGPDTFAYIGGWLGPDGGSSLLIDGDSAPLSEEEWAAVVRCAGAERSRRVRRGPPGTL